MQPVARTTLDPAFAIDYLQEQLSHGDRLGEALSNKPLSRGDVWTWTPAGVVIASKNRLLYDHGEVPYGSCREELYRFVADFLRENEHGLLLEEGELAQRDGRNLPEAPGRVFPRRIFLNEPSRHRIWLSATDPSPVHGVATFPWLDETFLSARSEEQTFETIDKTFRAGRSYPSISCLTVTDMILPQEKTSLISTVEIQQFADSAEHIIVGAFDECGCVVWTAAEGS